MAKTDKKVKLDFKTPVLVVDGNGIGPTTDKKGANIIFFQVRGEEGSDIKGDVVAAVRLDLRQMKDLRDSLDKALKDMTKVSKQN